MKASELRAGDTYQFPFGSVTYPRRVLSVKTDVKELAGIKAVMTEITHVSLSAPDRPMTVNLYPKRELTLISRA